MKWAMASVVLPPAPVRNPAAGATAETPVFFSHPGGDEGGTLGPQMLVRHGVGEVEVIPIRHPDRQPLKFQYRKAIRHARAAARNKEDTSQLIGVFDALPWRQVADAAEAFLSSERGRAIYAAEPHLPDILDDHAALRRTAKGSFAHAYCDFMESEGLSAAGMVAASGDTRNGHPMLPDGVEWYGDRLRDTHDILHVLAGYGRDPLGEQCVLAYLFHQRPSVGHLCVAIVATLLIKRANRSKAPVLRAVIEARRNGKLAPRIAEQSIRELLPLPLEEVRRRLNVPSPLRYQQVHRIWREEGIDPHAFFDSRAT